MYARVLVLFVLVSHMFVFRCVTVNNTNIADIISNTKIELSPLLITAKLGEIIVISAPMIGSNALYYLNKPNGDGEELKINKSRVITDKMTSHDRYKNIAIKYLKDLKDIINLVNNRIFNKPRSCFKEDMSEDFTIGPLVISDHGNWILSAYYKENNNEWIEFFQVITIEIKETIPTSPVQPILYPGEDFYLRFAYPLQHLESCEVVAPKTTFDRFYDRDKVFLDSCGFFIPNVTRADEGSWKIIGVGEIVYEANIFLQIQNNVT